MKRDTVLLCINLNTLQVTRYSRSLPGKVACLNIASLGESKEAHATLASAAGRDLLEFYRVNGRLQ